MLVLEAEDAHATIAPALGGRLASLVVRGAEVLITEAPDALLWGSFPMVPFAGRIRDGQFTFAGRAYQLERNWGQHAIHGTGFMRPWHVDGPAELSIDLGAGWPFAGRATQRFGMVEDRLRVSMTLEADEPMPAALGWHPSFRRRLSPAANSAPGSAARISPAPVELHFEADRMFVRDADGIPTGEMVAPRPRPWDDCFTGLRALPALSWPGALRLEISSSADYWVVYDERPHCVCVEPQSAIPDFVNLAPVTAEPGRPLEAWMEWRWLDAG